MSNEKITISKKFDPPLRAKIPEEWKDLECAKCDKNFAITDKGARMIIGKPFCSSSCAIDYFQELERIAVKYADGDAINIKINAQIYLRNLGTERFKSDPPSLIVSIGPPGCGKTTNTPDDHLRLCKDAIRFGLLNTNISRVFFESELEPLINEIHENIFKRLTEERFNLYIDSTNMTYEKRWFLVHYASLLGYSITYYLFSDFEKARKYNRNRERIVPDDVMNEMIAKFEKPSLEEIERYSIKVVEM